MSINKNLAKETIFNSDVFNTLEKLILDTAEVEEDTSDTSCYEGVYVIETASTQEQTGKVGKCFHRIVESF